MSVITRQYQLVSAKRKAETIFDTTPLKAKCANDHEFPFFGADAPECPTCKSTDVTKPDPLPDRREIEFHPEPGSPETFIGDAIMRFVVPANDPILGDLAIDSDWTLTFERTAQPKLDVSST